jgi:hypothetical protein
MPKKGDSHPLVIAGLDPAIHTMTPQQAPRDGFTRRELHRPQFFGNAMAWIPDRAAHAACPE